MTSIKTNMTQLRRRVDKLATSLDKILDDVIGKSQSMTWWEGLRLAFEINRISALVRTCEDQLDVARRMIDELDSHVAGKSFVANIFMYASLLMGIGW